MAPNCHHSPKTLTQAKKNKRKITLPQGAKAHGLKDCGDGSVSSPGTSRHGCAGGGSAGSHPWSPQRLSPGGGEAVANLCSQQSRWIPARLRKDMCQTQPPAALPGRGGLCLERGKTNPNGARGESGRSLVLRSRFNQKFLLII